VPAARRDPLDRGGEVAARRLRIGLAGGFEIDPHAADAGAVHLVERGVRRPVVDYRDAAGAVAEPAHAVEGAGIVAAIDARLHDDDARQVQAALQLQELIRAGRRRRVAAPRRERKFGCGAENVDMAIAGPEGHREGRRGSGLGRYKRPPMAIP